MTASAAPASSSLLFQQFGHGEIAIAPTLELFATYPREQLSALCNAVWRVTDAHHLVPEGEPVDILTVSDAGNDWRQEALTPTRLTALRQAFFDASRIPIRREPVTLLLAGRHGVEPALSHANAVRVTLATSFFPDDPLILSISVTSTAPNAWERLAAVRDALLACTEQRLLWSTLGYGFACDLDEVTDAGKQMELLCMRYLGVELQDPFGHYALTAPMGIRSVNWQLCVGPDWLKRTLPDGAAALAQSARQYKGCLLWRTGDHPSLCDRNNMADHDAIGRYRALHDSLRAIIFIPPVPWFPSWNVDSTARWENRWSDVEV